MGGTTSVPGGACGDDVDSDSIPAGCDNCPDKSNANQYDCDANGTGNACDYCMGWFRSTSCTLGVPEIVQATGCLSNPNSVSWCDLNEDGVSDTVDFGIVLCQYGSGGVGCCSLPSGACCGFHSNVFTVLNQPCIQVQESTCESLGDGTYLGDGVACPPSCTNGGDCPSDLNACTCETCSGCCRNTTVRYGNVNCAGPANAVDLDDILCCLGGFSNAANCRNADIHPPCAGNGIINLDDVLSVLNAFSGADPCGCLD